MNIKHILLNKKTFLFLLFFVSINFAQTKDPDKILENVVKNFEKVNDYEVNVKIKVDVDFLKVPVTDAKIYYKKPDKIQVESETFALLPKEGLDFSPVSLLKDNYTAIYSKEDLVDDFSTAVIKVIPAETNNIVLTTLWVDRKNDLIRKIESTTKVNGTFTIELNYDNKINFPLPSNMVFTFDVDKTNIPRGFNGDMREEKTKDDRKKRTTGKVFLDYTGYKVNEGISDKVFEEEKK